MAHAAKMCALLELLQRRLQEGLDRVRPFERKDLVNHLLQVSRAIDHAVASNQRPSAPQKVLDIFKMISKLKDDDCIKPSMMVFLLAIKGASRAGWFKPSEGDELLSLYDQLLMYFQLDGDCSRQLAGTGPTQEELSTAVTLITTVSQRYCPRIKLVSVILSFFTKKEYETRGCDFTVTQLAAKTKLSLFVIQTESTESSACLVTPNSLSFILNGRGVDRRSSLQNSPETGPQMPSDVTHLLRLGNNFVQVVGESPGQYMVAVATTSIIPCTSASVELAEYMVPSAEGDGIDDEVVEAGSRVSLRCPISHKRIITPVKGLLCRHHQCFDFDSYIEMNELRPVWRCPCCNSNVSCPQLRLDKKMKQILKDVDEKYFEAIVNQDGSWVPGQPSDEQKGSTGRFAAYAGAEHNHLSGPDVMMSENCIIDLSDDDEIKEPSVTVENVASPRSQPFSTMTGSSSEAPEDRKPDIGGTSGSNLLLSPALFCASSRERVNTSAGYSSLNDASSQTGLPINHPRGLTESNTGVRHMQNPAPTTHLWSGGNVSLYASSLSTVQPSGSRASSLERHAYAPTAGGQALQGTNHLLVQRARAGSLPQSVLSGTAANGGFVTTSQIQSSHLPPGQLASSEQGFQHDIPPQHQSQDLLRQMQLTSNSFRTPVEMDGSHRSQRRGPRNGVGLQQGTVTNDQGLAREVHMQQFGTAGPTLTEQLQQTQAYSHLGHNLNVSRQEYWQSQRVAQLQQAVLGNTSPRVTGGRSPAMSGVPLSSPTTVATAGSQHVASPRINPRIVNTGDGNMSTTFFVAPSNNTGVATPPVTEWRPTGRMRGSVSGGFVSVNRVGGNSVAPQPGSVNRTRVSAAPNTTSLPHSNSVNPVSAISNTSLPTTLLVPNVPSMEGVRVNAYNVSRFPSEDLGVPDAFLSSAAPVSSGETLQDVVWLSAVGPDQVDNIETQDVDRWLDETLLTNVSSHGL